MTIQCYDTLPSEAMEIRKAVFVEEQGFLNEFDEIDTYARHLVAFDDALPTATCRFYKEQGTSRYIIGRIAVIKAYRGRNIGSELLKEAEKIVHESHGESIALHAQLRVKSFYEKQGYSQYGEMDYDEDCPHIWMQKRV